MRNRVYVYMLACCLILILSSGCDDFFISTSTDMTTTATPQETITMMDISVVEALGIEPGSIESIEIVQMGDGKIDILKDQEQIGKIWERLGQIKFRIDLGMSGYTATGYHIVFHLKNQSRKNPLSIHLDKSNYSYCAYYNKHYYEISDEITNEYLNDYFKYEKYKE